MTGIRIPLILAILLSGCASPDTSPVSGKKSPQDRLGSAIISPLNDLNLVQTTIPPVITDALKNPYQLPDNISCPVLVEQIHKLDTALGADLDAIVPGYIQTNAEKGQELVENEAIGSVERTINGVIPFRSWIRRFSGAEKHSRELTTAIAAGVVRRAFLKGIGQEHGCEPPAAPQKHLPAVTTPITASPTIEAATESKNPSENTLPASRTMTSDSTTP